MQWGGVVCFWCRVMWRGVVIETNGVVLCCVVWWCVVVWCGVVWYGVVWFLFLFLFHVAVKA